MLLYLPPPLCLISSTCQPSPCYSHISLHKNITWSYRATLKKIITNLLENQFYQEKWIWHWTCLHFLTNEDKGNLCGGNKCVTGSESPLHQSGLQHRPHGRKMMCCMLRKPAESKEQHDVTGQQDTSGLLHFTWRQYLLYCRSLMKLHSVNVL